MALIYITGLPASGKSTLRAELATRGYETVEVDELANYVNNKTGEIVPPTLTAAERTKEWRMDHDWILPPEKITALMQKHQDGIVFVCGVAGNDVEIMKIVDKIFALMVDAETLHHRVISRESSDYGQNEHEYQTLMKWHKTAEQEYIDLGATIIDSSRPVEQVADGIIDASSKYLRG